MAEAILDYNSRIMSGAYVSGLEVEGVAKGGWGERTINITDLIGGDNLPHGCTRISGSSSVNTNNETISYLKSSYASGGGSVYRYRVFRG